MTSTIPPTTRHAESCTCGEAGEHVIAKRHTSDGKIVLFWSDGLVTFGMGFGIKGIGTPRLPEERAKNRAAALLLIEEVCLYEAAELPALIKRARHAIRKPGATEASVRAEVRRPTSLV